MKQKTTLKEFEITRNFLAETNEGDKNVVVSEIRKIEGCFYFYEVTIYSELISSFWFGILCDFDISVKKVRRGFKITVTYDIEK